MQEIWKTIPNYEKYEASTLGRIRNAKTLRILKPGINQTGHSIINIGKTLSVHRVIANTFMVNPDPEKYTDIHHIDNDKQNNALSNLTFVTHRQNIRDTFVTSDIQINKKYIKALIYKYIRCQRNEDIIQSIVDNIVRNNRIIINLNE